MAARTVETTDLMEEALKYLAKKAKVGADALFFDMLSKVLNEAVVSANVQRSQEATEILKGGDPAKIIPALKELLG